MISEFFFKDTSGWMNLLDLRCGEKDEHGIWPNARGRKGKNRHDERE